MGYCYLSIINVSIPTFSGSHGHCVAFQLSHHPIVGLQRLQLPFLCMSSTAAKTDHHFSSCHSLFSYQFVAFVCSSLCVRVCVIFVGLSPWRRKRIRASHCIYLPWVDTDARGQATWRRIGNWSSANGRRGSPGAHNCFSRFELEESIKQKLQGRLRIQLLTAQIKTWLFSLERTHARTLDVELHWQFCFCFFCFFFF